MDLPTQLQSALRQQTGVPLPSLSYLRTIIPQRTPPPPLASLIATARARLLAADLTTPNLLDPSYTSSATLPTHRINNPEIDTSSLENDIILQVLDIENLSRPRWEQAEELEAIERGEMTRGRQVIRIPLPGDQDDDSDSDSPPAPQNPNPEQQAGKNTTHRLVLQDCAGAKVFAIELKRIDRFGIGKTNIGEKVLVRKETRIARGVLLLEPERCLPLGGKVEVWHRAWVQGRLARLKEAVGGEEQER
ncbi:putative mediated genome instability protein rmi1 protein [Echria macrotheca]|uniref:Mediated genome instability protein rmi1 protein n=1 Tax=Echria macrotheca TaxID=438768 RepID=A0AAJ0FBE0_9PEZI|nr:putative mediated genome instability protein rmi1 protein [Echria macrotheca]